MPVDVEKFRQGKLYDFLMGLPLIYWFGYVGVAKVRPDLSIAARALLQNPGSLFANLHFLALFASVAFSLLLVYLIVVRDSPVRRSKGWLPRFCGFAGTFLGVGILYLPPAPLSLLWQSLAAALVLLGSAGSIIVLSKLGKSFSIMPEARTLVTTGPYTYARHPLYAVEILSIIGSAIQFQQPWAGLLALGVLILLVIRSHFEEQVLSEAYPEYQQYRARVKRFGFI
jgi:protein-S-isoprenylcysteine O-methyltransferase Ste14